MHIHAVILCASMAAAAAGCHHEPVIDTGERPPDVGGTIAGTVRSEGGSALVGRTVRATETSSGQTFEQPTAANGGFTIKVPAGTYRLELGLREGETLATRPEVTEVNVGDLDSQRDFVVAAR